jgi:hypothetical protein
LTAEEYELLESNYQVPNDPTKVNYVQFNLEIEKIFTEKHLEKDPLRKVEEFKAPSILDPKDVLNDEEEKCLHEIMVRIGTDVKFRRLLMMPFFKDKDRSNSGFISVSRFRAIFDSMKIRVGEEEFKLIAKRFQAKAHNEINYVEFNHVLKYYSGDSEGL